MLIYGAFPRKKTHLGIQLERPRGILIHLHKHGFITIILTLLRTWVSAHVHVCVNIQYSELINLIYLHLSRGSIIFKMIIPTVKIDSNKPQPHTHTQYRSH